MKPSPCPFCNIVKGLAPADIVYNSDGVLALTPLNPVTPGHAIFIPREHVADATENPGVTARVMRVASTYAQLWYPCNLITSAGPEATQTVMHLHIHLVPRRKGDDLKLPWS